MIYIHNRTSSPEAFSLVKLSFIRCYTKAQVCDVDEAGAKVRTEAGVHVFINPVADDLALIERLSLSPAKIIILGTMERELAAIIGLEISDVAVESTWDHCDAAPVYGFAESAARIRYEMMPDGLECFVSDRPLLRYDFSKEWNNLGYGHVRTDGSIWSIACVAQCVPQAGRELAHVYMQDDIVTAYASLSTLNRSEILWFNRVVGPIDSNEFRLFETFITNYKPDQLICLPMIKEIPYGYDAMISMRLDCDEAVASARPLFDLYRSYNIPFSLAIKTGQAIGEKDIDLINDILESGGAILSHSVNHKSNWGDDFADVLDEAEKSRHDILALTSKIENLDYAVSPFHQNPDFAVEALAAAGIKGFIGGIICNDPQYLIARSGCVVEQLDIISHSQQCMLHGDCLLKSVSDGLVVNKQSAYQAIKSGVAFGFLDHPFSERYQYGWFSESQRVKVHMEWIEYLKGYVNTLFVNEVNLLEYINYLSTITLFMKGGEFSAQVPAARADGLRPAIEFKNEVYPVN